LTLDASGAFVRSGAHPMGSELIIPWVGTSGTAHDGDYAAVVILAGEGGASEDDGVTYVEAKECFTFQDGTSISLERLAHFDA